MNSPFYLRLLFRGTFLAICVGGMEFRSLAQAPGASVPKSETLAAALNQQTWVAVEQSMDKALSWLATQQLANGSFAAPSVAQPAATSLAVMAYLSRGHLPGEGPYGSCIERGIDFVLKTQQSSGLLAYAGTSPGAEGKTANYNHAIAGLMLTETYGLTDSIRAGKLKSAILRALEFTRNSQHEPKANPEDKGGWRYLYGASSGDSDLSMTGWQLMFLRSAKNAEFQVSKEHIDEAIGYVLRCWEENEGIFYYKKYGTQRRSSRGMVGAGILSLAMAGQHDTPIAKRAGDWLMRHPYSGTLLPVGDGDRFFYSTYYCSQAMAQLGGQYWKQFFPYLANTLLNIQEPSGAWPAEPGGDVVFGNTYTTALSVLSLTPPLQLLPVYQR